jgi:hypothetical protein
MLKKETRIRTNGRVLRCFEKKKNDTDMNPPASLHSSTLYTPVPVRVDLSLGEAAEGAPPAKAQSPNADVVQRHCIIYIIHSFLEMKTLNKRTEISNSTPHIEVLSEKYLIFSTMFS